MELCINLFKRVHKHGAKKLSPSTQVINLLFLLVSCAAFIIIDTHKVKDDAGGKQSGLLAHFPFECNNRDKVIDGIVDWVSLRMKSYIINAGH